jgi:hypothetical protein
MQSAVDTLQGVNLPDIEKMKLQLEKEVQQGTLTPEMANTILQEQTAMAGISTDPRLKNAQLAALADLQGVADSKGLTVADKAGLNQIASDENTRERGQREAIIQNAQQRGVAGSGLELAAKLANEQGSATNASQRGFDVAKQAQDRALQAMINTGQLGGQIRGQDFSEQESIAQAKDAINKFNTANQNTVQMANIQAKNNAAAQNLAEKQRIADTNVGTGNYQQQYNKSLAQQQFENEMKKKAAIANAYSGQASNFQTDATRTGNVAGNIINAGAQLLKKKGDPLSYFI